MSEEAIATTLHPPAHGLESAYAERGIRQRIGLRALLSSPALPLAALVVCCGLLAWMTWGTWGDLSRDTGYDLLAGAKTAHGQLPYIDYVYYYGPLAPFLLAGVYALFGAGIGPAIALGLGLVGAILVLTYRLARELVPPVGAALATGLAATAAFASSNSSYVLPHTTSAPLAIVGCLGTLYAVACFLHGRSRWWLGVAGSLLGLVMLTRPEFVAALVVAIGMWLVLRAVMAPGRRRRVLHETVLIAAPAILIVGVVYGLILTRISLHTLLANDVAPTGAVGSAAAHVLREAAPLTLSSVVTLGARLLLYAAGAAVLCGLGVIIGRGERWGRLALAVCVVAAVAFLAVLALRPEATRHALQFVYGWLPAGLWVACGLLAWRAWRGRSDGWSGAAQIELLIVAFTAILATKTYGAFFPYANLAHPQAAAYAMPFAAVCLAWLHLRALPGGRRSVQALGGAWLCLLLIAGTALAIRDARSETVTVRALHGELAALPSDGAAYQAAVDIIERTTRPGAPILLAPQMTALYVMTGRSEPLPQLSLLPGALAAPGAEKAAIGRLRDVRLVITDRRPFTEYGYGSFGSSFDRQIEAWLQARFHHVATLRGVGPDARVLDVWSRA